MKKLLALLVAGSFIIAGCSSDKPDHLVVVKHKKKCAGTHKHKSKASTAEVQ